MAMVLEVNDLRYHLRANGKPLVDGISFSVGAGEKRAWLAERVP